MTSPKPVLLASDVHYGAIPPDSEQAFLGWLDHAGARASRLILNGDLFDFWYEFRAGIPGGYEPLLTKLREIAATGLPVTLTGGNHDWWGGRYLREEIGVEFLQEPVVREIAGRRTFLAHGDGLGAGDVSYRYFLKPLLRSAPFRFGFDRLPVAVGERVAERMSRTEERGAGTRGPNMDRSAALEAWALEELRRRPELDLVLLGHTHDPMIREVGPDRWYVNSGDWVFHRSYVTLEPGRPPRLDEWEGAS